MIKKYKVECLECHKSDVLTIDEPTHRVIDTENKFSTNFMSFRWRKDMQWGFMCECSNDNRLAPSEAENFDELVRGDPITLKKITASLLIPDEKQFKMETI